MYGAPVFILAEGTKREKGNEAIKTNALAAQEVAKIVRTTLGPKGMDKMLVDELGDIIITNDGATILKEMNFEHPVAKMMVEVAKTQESEVGDGTTTAVVIAGELLKKAVDLLDQNIHPSIIIKGYRMAQEKAIEYLEHLSDKVTLENKEELIKVAETSMNSKNVSGKAKQKLAKIVVDAITQVAEDQGEEVVIDRDLIKIQKKEGGSLEDSKLIKGIVIDKEVVHPGMPKVVKNSKIALLDCALEIKKPETDAAIRITSPEQLQAFLDQEEKMLKSYVDKIVETGANVVFCQKGIDDIAQHFLAKQGILAVRRVKKSDMEKIAKATGARIVSNIKDLSDKDLGYAEKVEEKKVGGESLIFIEGCKDPKAVTILLRGGSSHVVDEAERAIDDALGAVCSALVNKRVVAGGGAPEVELELKLKEYATKVGGKHQLAIEAFADALSVIPRTLAESAGMDPIEALVELKAKHKSGEKYFGINVIKAEINNMKELGVLEPARVKEQAINSAAEVAEMILKIDDVILAKKTDAGNKGLNMPEGLEY